MARAAGFIEPMECLPVSRLPEGSQWTYELKLDGYRLEVVKEAGKAILYSRRGNILNQKVDHVAEALKHLPAATVVDCKTGNYLRIRGVSRKLNANGRTLFANG